MQIQQIREQDFEMDQSENGPHDLRSSHTCAIRANQRTGFGTRDQKIRALVR